MTKLTSQIIYKDLYKSAFNALVKYGISEDQASRKANIYAVKHTWHLFSSDNREAVIYRRMLDFSLNGDKQHKPLSTEEFNALLDATEEPNATVS